MNDAVAAYLERLGLTDTLRTRVNELIDTYEAVLGLRLEDVFVSEYTSDEAGRVFESVWAFTDELVMEAKIPDMDGDQFDFVPLRHSVRHWVVRKKDYQFNAADASSRLSMEVWLADNRVGNLRASWENCDHLYDLGLRRVLPNVASLASEANPEMAEATSRA